MGKDDFMDIPFDHVRGDNHSNPNRDQGCRDDTIISQMLNIDIMLHPYLIVCNPDEYGDIAANIHELHDSRYVIKSDAGVEKGRIYVIDRRKVYDDYKKVLEPKMYDEIGGDWVWQI